MFRVSKIKPYVNNLNWENTNFPPQEEDYEQLEMNNKSIALNILQINNNKKISHYYKSDFNKIRENKVILLMLTDYDNQHYLFVKSLSLLLKIICARSDNYYINCLKPFTIKLKLRIHEESC